MWNKREIRELIVLSPSRISYTTYDNPNRSSFCWERFKIINVDGSPVDFVKCNTCDLVFVWTAKGGTSTLNRHLCCNDDNEETGNHLNEDDGTGEGDKDELKPKYQVKTNQCKDRCIFCLKICYEKPEVPYGGILGAVNCESLEIPLLQHFVLRKLMDISQDWCEETMKRYSGDNLQPAFWLRLCQHCFIEVDKAWNIYQQLLGLEDTFNMIRENLRETMKKNNSKIRPRIVEGRGWETDIRCLLFADDERLIRRQSSNEDDMVYFESVLSESPSQDLNLHDDSNNRSSHLPGHARVMKLSSKSRKNLRMKTDIISRTKRKYRKRNRTRQHKPKFVKCRICPVRLTDTDNLESHMECHKESIELGLSCEICSYPARTQEELDIHQYNDHDKEVKKYSRAFACGKCDFTADVWRTLRNHADEQHPDVLDIDLGPDIELKCLPCEKFFETANTLINHQKKMHPEMFGAALEPVQCEHCSQLLPSDIHLHYHIKSIHKRLNAFICDICGKGFSQRRRLERHNIMHEPKLDFTCHICGCNYSYKSALSKHYKIFHPECSRNNRKELNTATVLSIPEQSFKCKYCDLTFSFKAPMLRHLQTHKQTIGVQCQLCFKYYVSSQGLRQHMKLSHPTTDQSTSCPHCLKVFANPHAMHTHSMKYCKMKKMKDGPLSMHPLLLATESAGNSLKSEVVSTIHENSIQSSLCSSSETIDTESVLSSNTTTLVSISFIN